VSGVDALLVEAPAVVHHGQFVGQVEGDVVLLGGVGTDVAENLEGEVVLPGERGGFVGNLRGDGHQAGAAFAAGVVVLLPGPQREIAVRAPGAVEGQPPGAFGEREDLAVQALLDQHDRHLRDAPYAALDTARRRGQLAGDTSAGAAADVPALLAYGVNRRSRAGEDAAALQHTVAAALAPLESPARRGKD